MIGRRRKEQPTQRSPHLNTQKQSVFHYSSNRSQTEHERPRQTESSDAPKKISKLKRTLMTTPYVVGAAVAIILGVVFSSLSGDPKIVVAGGSQPLRENADYSETAAKLAEESVGGYTKFTVNREKITEGVQTAYPELTNVSVTTPLFARSLVIKADMSIPAAVLTTDAHDYLIDARGMTLFDLKKTRASIKTDKLINIIDQSQTPIEIGKPALTSVQVLYALEIKHQAESKQLEVESAELTAGGGELHVRFKGLPYLVKFNIYEDARKSFGTFIAAKEQNGVKPTEYIDVRVAERAYVK